MIAAGKIKDYTYPLDDENNSRRLRKDMNFLIKHLKSSSLENPLANHHIPIFTDREAHLR